MNIGARVFVGYCPDDQCRPGSEAARLRVGTVTEGPICPNARFVDARGQPWTTRGVAWRVELDDFPAIIASERILFPIDDDDDSESEALLDDVLEER